jgi:antitoxin MazE
MYIHVSRTQEASMAVTLQKWGNSVGVRLPKPMLEQVGLKEGAQVEVLVEGDHLVIRRERLKLADLLAQCRPENRPDPIDFGPPVGREMI